MKKSEISILAGLIICLAINYFADVNTTAAAVRGETLRLHIIAHDNTDRAQEIKLAVRDELQPVFSSLYSSAGGLEDAVDITQENLEYIRMVANNTLKAHGAPYTAKCAIEQFDFDTTQYDGFTLPRGSYTALTVRLGDAKGRNWWCVAYPSLCLSSAAKYENDAANTFIETDSLRIKFKAVEIRQNIRKHFSSAKEYTNY